MVATAAPTTATWAARFSYWIPSTKVSLTTFEVHLPLPLPVRTNTISLKVSPVPLPSLLRSRRRSRSLPCSVLQETAVYEKEVLEDEKVNRRKLYVVNLPWDFSASDFEKLFGQYGTVEDVEIIKQKNGKSRGFAFVSMSSPEEALVAIQKLDSFELSGRTIRVELAKSFKTPYTRTNALNGEIRSWIYVSNLDWKVRAANLRDFFSVKFKPVSARVVFDGPSGGSAGYGFISFATSEEALLAISELNGKELMGRSLALKISQKDVDEPNITPED